MKWVCWKSPLWFVGIIALYVVGETQSFAETSRFYSWVTQSGEMVLTDDPGQIPSASARGPVSVHHYQEASRTSPLRSNSAPIPVRSQVPEVPIGTSMDIADSEAADLMDILLEPPEQSLAASYDWVPLASPMYLGSGPVYGFWSSRAMTNPSAAWARYVHRLQKLAPPSLSRHWTRQVNSRRSSAASAQFVQDRQALLVGLQTGAPSPNPLPSTHTPMPSSRCCTMNHHQGSGRRSASRR